MRVGVLAAAATALLVATPAVALAYDEFTEGDLSNDPAAPTPLVFGLGANRVMGRVTSDEVYGLDTRDYLTFTIPPGRQLSGLRANISGTSNRGFHAINVGATSFIPDFDTRLSFLGGDHADPTLLGTIDLLAELLDGDSAGTGATAPLGPGTYSYLIQENGPRLLSYQLDFVVSAAPAGVPASDHKVLIGLTVALLGVMLVGRRRSGRGA